jgi:diguanylate cyclase
MSEPTELVQARSHAENAFRAMLANDVPPSPSNYAVWFAYVAGTLPELKRTIDILLSNKQSFTPERNAELYSRYCDSPAQVNLLQESGGRLLYIVDQVRKHLTSAAGDATSFGRTLDDFSTAIGDQGEDEVRVLISDLVVETQKVAQRNRALEERLSRTSGEVSELKQSLETSQREALTDGLTGIPNRKSFDTHLREAARDAMENDEHLSLILADIDHFKRFNDAYGHQIGDQVLRLVARSLTDSVKGRDTPARYGGEEFAIILPQTKLPAALVVAEQIRVTLMRRRLVGQNSRDSYGNVTLSFGAAQFRPGEPLADFLRRADAALYLAKRQGRNRVATEEMLPPEAKAAS